MALQEQALLLEQLTQIASERASQEAMRAAAWKRFLSQGLPGKQEEAFRYLSLRELYAQTFYVPETSQALIPKLPAAAGNPRFVFIDGIFSTEHSTLEELPKEAVFCTLKEAQRSYGALLDARASKNLQGKRSSFALLNDALYEEGFFLYLPPKTQVMQPIEILDLYSSAHPSLYTPKLSVYLGKNAQAVFHIQAKNSLGRSPVTHWVTRCIEFHLDQQSRCYIHNQLLDLGKCWYFDQIFLYLKRDASCHYTSADIGSRLLRQDFKVELLEENAEALLQGLSVLQHKDQSHHYVQMQHLAPSCKSSQHFKGVLFDQTRLSFEGKIWVDPSAQKTEAYQLSNHLLLGEHACAYSKPNLEIFADDVKASHGATVSQLSQDEIFYLQARGLGPTVAKKILVKGFCKELIEQMTFCVKDVMMRYLQQGLDA